ncbi:hypothetical protein GCM10010329_77940 [Streptomyces spiroverticillatus]|uniref:Uncharacterized protein n=1 Tax=Streptomyces finlayi TaxID=67296 RepID=A0A918X569_9ACTN|nr:hypothetical protein GCM10010329_77940 [Streptomyces spiroverticillatus]GHD13359.1 hypothetical protein GCM10010334_71410 [Streptomyces finlayi]
MRAATVTSRQRSDPVPVEWGRGVRRWKAQAPGRIRLAPAPGCQAMPSAAASVFSVFRTTFQYWENEGDVPHIEVGTT